MPSSPARRSRPTKPRKPQVVVEVVEGTPRDWMPAMARFLLNAAKNRS